MLFYWLKQGSPGLREGRGGGGVERLVWKEHWHRKGDSEYAGTISSSDPKG